jgi:hypothetical protein
MGCDRLRFDQGYVVNEQAYDAFALAGINARVIPDLRQLFGETENTSASLGTKCRSLVLASALVFLDGLCVKTQLSVPIRLEGIGDEAVVGVDLHVAPTRQLGFILHPLDMLAARRIGLGSASLELALNFQSDRQRHRCHQFDHQGRHRCIDELAGN